MKARAAELGGLLESFFRHRLLAQRRASPQTVAAYRDALKLLLVFVSDQVHKEPSRLALADLDRDTVLSFLDHLEAKRGNCTRTRNARLAAIHSFFQNFFFVLPAKLFRGSNTAFLPELHFIRVRKHAVNFFCNMNRIMTLNHLSNFVLKENIFYLRK